MGLNHSPKIVTSNLVFTYDMSNTDKSWKGAPATNLLNSSNFTGWATYVSADLTPNAILAPDGSMTGMLQSQATGSTNNLTYQQGTFTIGATYTASMYFKRGTKPTCGIMIDDNDYAGNRWLCSYNWTSEYMYLANPSAVQDAGIALPTATVTKLSDDWIRLAMTFVPLRIGSPVFFANRDFQATGGTTYLWGAQLELGTFATPYIPTTTGAVSRLVTQAILDPIGKNTLIANSLSYASNNTFSFNGANSYIETPKIPGTGTGSSSLTWSVWCSPSTTGNGDIINMRDVSTGWDMCPIYSTGQRFYGKVWNGPVIAGLSTYNLNQYYYLTVVYDNAITDKIKFYINGELQGFNQSSYSASGNTSGNSLYFGRAGNQATLTHFNGKIPAAAIYTKALSAEEVKQNFNALRGRYGI